MMVQKAGVAGGMLMEQPGRKFFNKVNAIALTHNGIQLADRFFGGFNRSLSI